MDRRGVLGLVVMAVGMAASPGAVAPAPAPPSQEMDGRLVVSVRIGDHGPFRFRIDTGASRTVMTERVLRASRAPVVGTTRLVTHTGGSRRALAFVAGLAAGCFSPASVVAVVAPDSDVDPAGRVDGLLGQDVLASAVYTLDFERRRVECHARAGEADGHRLPLRLVGGRAMVTLSVGGAPLHLVADSGADRLVLLARPDGGGAAVTPLDIVPVRSLTGQRLARRVLVHGLGPAGAPHEGLLIDGAAAGGLMGDGLLPLRLFGRVTVDGPGGWLIVGRAR